MSCVTGLPLQPWTLSSWSGTCYHAIRHPRGIRIERARKGFEENLWETFGLWSVTKNLPRCLNVNLLRFRALWILQAVRSWGLLTFASQFYGTLNFFSNPSSSALLKLETAEQLCSTTGQQSFDKWRLRCAGSSRRISHKDPRIKKTSSIPCTQNNNCASKWNTERIENHMKSSAFHPKRHQNTRTWMLMHKEGLVESVNGESGSQTIRRTSTTSSQFQTNSNKLIQHVLPGS